MILPPLKAPAANTPLEPRLPTDPTKLREAARAFEAMALGALLTPIFETVDPSQGPFGGGAGEAAWRPMMIEHMAKKISQAGGLGLAHPIHEAMLRLQEARNP